MTDEAFLLDTPMLEMGSVIGDFRILSALGSGTYANVYLVEPLKPVDAERWGNVALKYFKRKDLQIEELFEEVFYMAKLSPIGYHVEIHQAFPKERYFIMKFMENGTLKDKLRSQGTIPLQEAIQVVYRLCKGLTYMHEKGILHRDIAPRNIFFDENHTAMLGDLGCAIYHKDPAIIKVTGHKPYIDPLVIQGGGSKFSL